ncbi:MAG: ATPase, T2SS/T4P/T4SS family [Elusimicrobiota bacterium]|nr:ATPase, T2SS/T4P/T4SS family [Elusimicrobiota bacterium]
MSKAIAIIDTREGLGQSLISTNLAMTLAYQLKKETGLLNANIQSSAFFSFLMSVAPGKKMTEVLKVVNRLDARMLKGFLARHESGVMFMDSEPEDELKYSEVDLVALTVLFKESFEYSLITCGKHIDDSAVQILDECGLLLLVVSPHLLAVKEAKFIVEQLKKRHYPLEFIKVVLNMSSISGGLDAASVRAHLGVEVIAEIPFDSQIVIQAINEGTPPLTKYPHAPFSVAIKNLGKFLIEKAREEEGSFFRAAEERKERAESKETSAGNRDVADGEDVESRKITLKKRIHKKLIDEFDFKSFEMEAGMDKKRFEEIKKKTREIIENIIANETGLTLSREDRAKVVYELVDEVLGLGPLESLLSDDAISEIMVNGPNDIYIEKGGKITLSGSRFTSEEQLSTVIDRILAPIGRRVDESSPLVDARLQDGSRVNVIIPPLSLIGPTITIRKFVAKKMGMDDLVKMNSITQNIIDFLQICVRLRKNMFISGGTGSGKTTLLNMLSSFIPDDERIVTIEDSAELSLRQRHVVTLESKPPNIEGKGEIPIRRLVINSLRMRPDRIIVGECRGGEALDMLQAMNTGHDGSMTTLHANTPKDAIQRLTTLVIMAGTELPEKAIKEQIASAMDIIVQTSRLSDGSRKIVNVTEMLGLENGELKLQDLFCFHQKGLDKDKKVVGEFKATGKLPSFYDDIGIQGLELSKEIFKAN